MNAEVSRRPFWTAGLTGWNRFYKIYSQEELNGQALQ
jgi:hypothetical protein